MHEAGNPTLGVSPLVHPSVRWPTRGRPAQTLHLCKLNPQMARCRFGVYEPSRVMVPGQAPHIFQSQIRNSVQKRAQGSRAAIC